jgi:hypothetical protein
MGRHSQSNRSVPPEPVRRTPAGWAVGENKRSVESNLRHGSKKNADRLDDRRRTNRRIPAPRGAGSGGAGLTT